MAQRECPGVTPPGSHKMPRFPEIGLRKQGTKMAGRISKVEDGKGESERLVP